MGSYAARLLLERVGDRRRPTTQVKLSPRLVVRESTAAPA
nr:substrate-binding domain-containing protein [Streptomyces sp. SCL15-6]